MKKRDVWNMSFSSFCRKPSGRSKASAMTSGGNFNRIDSISSRRPHAQAMVESGPQNFHFGKNSHIHMTSHDFSFEAISDLKMQDTCDTHEV